MAVAVAVAVAVHDLVKILPDTSYLQNRSHHPVVQYHPELPHNPKRPVGRRHIIEDLKIDVMV